MEVERALKRLMQEPKGSLTRHVARDEENDALQLCFSL